MSHFRIVAACALTVSLAGCALPTPSGQPSPAQTSGATSTAIPTTAAYVLGSAWLDADLAGATVTLLDGEGKQIAQFPNATNALGTFALPLNAALPSRFRVVVSGGSLGANANTDTVMADFENFDAAKGVASVNALTTLAAKYLDANPGTKPADALAAVKAYVGLSPDARLDFETASDAVGTFSTAAFLQAARAEGGLDAFTAKLAAELGTDKTRRFEGEPRKLIFGLTLGQVGVELFKGALSKIGGDAFGYAMAQIGYEDQATKDKKEILDAIAKQKEQLDAIRGDIQALSGQVESSKKEILAALNQTDFNAQAAAVEQANLREIDDLYARMVNYVKMGPQDKKAFYALTADWRQSVKSRVGQTLSGINLGLMSTASKKGLLETWTKLQADRFTDGKSPALVDNRYLAPVNTMYEYYYGYQIKALTLLLEAYHMDAVVDTAAIQTYMDAFQENTKAQLAVRGYQVMNEAVAAECLYDRVNRVMWKRAPIAFSDNKGGLVDTSTFDGTNGSWIIGPKLILTEKSFNGILNANNQRVGAAVFTGWRTPTAAEMSNMALTGTYHVPMALLNKSGMQIDASSTKYFATSTPGEDINQPAYWFVNADTGVVFKTQPGYRYPNVKLLTCRTITDFNEPQQ